MKKRHERNILVTSTQDIKAAEYLSEVYFVAACCVNVLLSLANYVFLLRMVDQ